MGMPFTFSHPAVILPFNRMASGRLSMTGLVIGSMTPDFEYFFRGKILSLYSHTWIGLFWFDLPLGVMVLIVYELWIKEPLINHLPTNFYQRFNSLKGYRRYYSLNYFTAIFVSVFLGAASHILWDGFTHRSGFFVHHITFLSRMVRLNGYRFYLYSCLQFASTAVGAIVILLTCFMLPRERLTKNTITSGFWLQVALVTVVLFVVRLATGLKLHEYNTVIVTLIDGGLLGLITASVLST